MVLHKFNPMLALSLAPELSLSALNRRIKDYFDEIEEELSSPTVAGLCLAINYPLQKIWAIEADVTEDNKARSLAITSAKMRIADHYEKSAHMNKKSPHFNIFMLKALGYPDKVSLDLTPTFESLALLAKQANDIRNEKIEHEIKHEGVPIPSVLVSKEEKSKED